MKTKKQTKTTITITTIFYKKFLKLRNVGRKMGQQLKKEEEKKKKKRKREKEKKK